MVAINDLPLILCGPIVRRVEPGQVAIWLALKASATVELSVWEGLLKHEDIGDDFPVGTVEQDTVEIGKHLHLVTVMLKLEGEKKLKPGKVYAYNISFKTTDGQTRDFQDLKLLDLLQEGLNTLTTLSYADGQLPSFVLPADEIENLKIIHGSCRNNDNHFEDALAWVDDFIKDDLENPDGRPQQLFLSGDQIYADSVTGSLLHQLTERATLLFDGQETLPTDWPNPADKKRAKANQNNFPAFIRHRLIDSEARFTTSDQENHLISFGEFACMYMFVWSDVLWDIDDLQDFQQVFDKIQEVPEENYGALFRKNLTDERAGNEIEVTIDGRVKKITAKVFDDDIMLAALSFLLEELDKEQLKDFLTNKNTSVSATTLFDQFSEPEKKEECQYFVQYFKDWVGGLYANEKEEENKPENKRRDTRRKNQVKVLHRTLPKVRRALANISTYMIFDDHEVTDDWNLNPIWRDRVLTSRLGKSIIRNGMTAYALFQDWGNRPDKYNRTGHLLALDVALASELVNQQFTDTFKDALAAQGINISSDKGKVKKLAKDEWLLQNEENGDEFTIRKDKDGDTEVLKVLGNPHAFLLNQVPKLFTADEAVKIATEETIDRLLGLDFRITEINGRFQLPDNRSPLLKWHYTYNGPKHKVLVIDNRTRRTYVTDGTPGNLSINGMKDLIPEDPQPGEDEVLFVVAPLPVIGPSVLDELVAPLAFKAFDMIGAIGGKEAIKAGMRGTNPDAIEAWVFDPIAQEELFKRLAPFKKIILLSGDVHYGSSQRMLYWKKGVDNPACFAQFTASGFRNIMPSYIQLVSQHFPIGQKLLRQEIRAERMGWHKNTPMPLKDIDEASAFLKHKLRSEPVIIPTSGWPEGAKVVDERPADWSWRVQNILDRREEEDRPELTRIEAITPGKKERTINAFRDIARRHITQAKKVNYTRQILFKVNLGIITFDKPEENKLFVEHNLHAVPYEADLDKPPQEHQLYAVHRLALNASAEEEKPEIQKKPTPEE